MYIGLSHKTQVRYSVAFPFLRWGIFLPMGTEDFRKFPASLIFYLKKFPLSSNAIIKQCNIHIYSISNLGYHTIIYKYYIALYISILVSLGYWPQYPYDPLISDPWMMLVHHVSKPVLWYNYHWSIWNIYTKYIFRLLLSFYVFCRSEINVYVAIVN